MKKLNRQEITAIAYRIQENINQQRLKKVKSIAQLTKEAKQSDEYREMAKLNSNSAVRRALDICGISKYNDLSNRMDRIINSHIRNYGYGSRGSVNGTLQWTYVTPTITDKIKRDITLEQLIPNSDVESLIATITKKYTNEI